MKTIIFLLGCLWCSNTGFSQQEQAFYAKVTYQGGMILHPGLNLGLAYPIWKQAREKKNGKLITRELRLGLNAGFYYHRRLHTGLNCGPEMEFLRTGSKGGQLGLSFESGYLRTFIPASFEVSDVGTVSPAGSSGTNHFFYSPGIRFGKVFRISKHRELAWYVRPKLQFQTPYIGRTNKYFQTEIGVNFKL